MALSLNKKIAVSSLLILVMSFSTITVFLSNGGGKESHGSSNHGQVSVVGHDAASSNEESIGDEYSDSTFDTKKIDKVLQKFIGDEKSMILVTDLDGEILYKTENVRKKFKIKENSNFQGSNLFDCIHKEDLADFTKDYAKAIKEDGTELGPIRVKIEEKDFVLMLTIKTYKRDGEANKVLFSIKDMSEKFKKIKDSIEEIEENEKKDISFDTLKYFKIAKK